MNKPTKAKAKERLQRALDAIPALKELSPESLEFKKWRRDTLIALAYTFGEDTRQSRVFTRIKFSKLARVGSSNTFITDHQAYLDSLVKASGVLNLLIDEIEEYWSDEIQATAPSQTPQPTDAKKVFIVHGHDHGTREMVARFIQQLKLEPVILQERPNQGLTIIEKIERHADVGFSVVLFTPDDIGSAKDDADNTRYRA